jgi:hypothetical protein
MGFSIINVWITGLGTKPWYAKRIKMRGARGNLQLCAIASCLVLNTKD